MSNKEPKKIGDKIHRNFSMVRDQKTLAELYKSVNIEKDNAPKNGFWALASVELPEGDSDGDIIKVAGINSDLDPESGRFLPLLPGHKMSLSDGKAAEIGRIEKLVKTTYKDMPALAMYFTFALDENGVPLDDLVASYYKRYVNNYSNTFSVGMSATEKPEPNDLGGYTFGKSHLYEVSCVSIPANAGAIGLTRSKEDDMIIAQNKLLDELTNKINELTASIEQSFVKAFEPLEQRLDQLESHIVVKEAKKAPVEPLNRHDSSLLKSLNEVLDKHIKSK